MMANNDDFKEFSKDFIELLKKYGVDNILSDEVILEIREKELFMREGYVKSYASLHFTLLWPATKDNVKDVTRVTSREMNANDFCDSAIKVE